MPLMAVIALPDPVGEISELRQRPSGIQVGRMRVPLGVIGITAVASLAGAVGESALGPSLHDWISPFYKGPWLEPLTTTLSFLVVTGMFILFADLLPKRLAMLAPERLARRLVRPLHGCIVLFKPIVWIFNTLSDKLISLFGLPAQRTDELTFDDISAVAAISRIKETNPRYIKFVCLLAAPEGSGPLQHAHPDNWFVWAPRQRWVARVRKACWPLQDRSLGNASSLRGTCRGGGVNAAPGRSRRLWCPHGQ